MLLNYNNNNNTNIHVIRRNNILYTVRQYLLNLNLYYTHYTIVQMIFYCDIIIVVGSHAYK